MDQEGNGEEGARAVKKMTKKAGKCLKEIIPLCDDLDADEMAWVVAACFKLLSLKLSGDWERIRCPTRS